MASTMPADVQEYRSEAHEAVPGGHRDDVARPETQISFVGLLAWALPPLALIGTLIVQGS